MNSSPQVFITKVFSPLPQAVSFPSFLNLNRGLLGQHWLWAQAEHLSCPDLLFLALVEGKAQLYCFHLYVIYFLIFLPNNKVARNTLQQGSVIIHWIFTVLQCRQKPSFVLPSHIKLQITQPLTVARSSTQAFYRVITTRHGTITLEQGTWPRLDYHLLG